jgi:serine/threonine-protein kinase RsbW
LQLLERLPKFCAFNSELSQRKNFGSLKSANIVIIASLRRVVEKKDLAGIRHFVEATGNQLGLESSVIAALRQAVDEAVSNILIHGYQGQAGPLRLDIGRKGANLWVRLRDKAPPFDPNQVPPPDLTLPAPLRPPGGLGLPLIRQAIDELRYRPLPGGGNELTLVKREVIR